MDNPIRPSHSSPTARNLKSYYNVDRNAFISTYLKEAHDRSLKIATETPIGAMCINNAVRYIIGDGLFPQSSPERIWLNWTDEQARTFSTEAEAFFRIITGSKEFDYYGKDNFPALQRVAFRNILIHGDVLVHRSYFGKAKNYRPYIQLLSGSWVRNPDMSGVDTKNQIAGVELDDRNREVGYWIAVTDENNLDTFSSKKVSKYNRTTGFEEYDLIKLGALEANQVRGIPYLTAVEESILDLDAMENAYRTKAIVQAMFTVFIEKDKDAPESATTLKDDAKALALGMKSEENDFEATDVEIKLGPGNVFTLNEGEHVNMAESKIATVDFIGMRKALLLDIGSALGLPRGLLEQEFNSSFSASKAEINSAYKGFKVVMQEVGDKVCTPTWEQVVDYGIRLGVINAPGYLEADELTKKAMLAVTWIGPTAVSIDPVKEVNAQVAMIAAGLTTRERAIRELNGMDFDEVSQRLAQENAKLKELGLTEEPSTIEEKEEDE